MKQLCLLIICFLSLAANAQLNENKVLQANRAFAGSKATARKYRVIYQLDSNNSIIIEKAIRNINNAVNDSGLKDKLQVERFVSAAITK